MGRVDGQLWRCAAMPRREGRQPGAATSAGPQPGTPAGAASMVQQSCSRYPVQAGVGTGYLQTACTRLDGQAGRIKWPTCATTMQRRDRPAHRCGGNRPGVAGAHGRQGRDRRCAARGRASPHASAGGGTMAAGNVPAAAAPEHGHTAGRTARRHPGPPEGNRGLAAMPR